MAGESSSKTTRTIILATTIPSVLLVVLLGIYLHRRVRRRRAGIVHRNITPVDDDEIESWKVDRSKPVDEKKHAAKSPISETKSAHQSNTSVGSVQKPPSLIIYHGGGSRASDDHSSCWSPAPLTRQSVDSPQTPVFARAPNSRPGLTDESIRGDEAFVPFMKRQPSRLTKLPSLPMGSPRHARTRSSRSSCGDPTRRELWWPSTPDGISARPSFDTLMMTRTTPASPRTGRRATVSTPSGIAIHHASHHEEHVLSGLSPRPLIHRSEIGRAIG